ncbi:MAG: ABC transporter permease [Deltaproteobacteria bacterium]|jgi:putative ABC transport system permease protein|nr:ABC transporter permease [Deltaproteobacteria bacterium]MBW2533015.1 ABC transporter permease [Deltaproteobacteria bacterium]
MMIGTLLMALSEIRRNAMRSFLTMLGVVIGVGSVIALVTVGDGTTAGVKQSISSLGENLLMIRPGAHRRGPARSAASPFEVADADAIREEIAGAAAVAPSGSKQMLAVYGNQNWSTSVTGTSADYFAIRGLELGEGRLINASDVKAGRPVCVIGATPAKELFGSTDPLNESIRLGKLSCKVVGVLASKGSGSMGMDNDDTIVLPLRTFQQRIAGSRDVSMIYVTVSDDRPTSNVKMQIEALLRERRRIAPGAENDFDVRDVAEIIETVSQATGMLTALLAAIAGVSLLVGGIGIMNIMLVSVTERTREIGIRLAIGARGRDVLLQFLIEAMVLSTIGGGLGVALGLGGGYAATNAMDVPFIVSPQIVAVAFLFSAFIGVLFGFLPARKAARLDPIDALRHE